VKRCKSCPLKNLKASCECALRSDYYCSYQFSLTSIPVTRRHPAFEEDEIELIVLGGVLGAREYTGFELCLGHLFYSLLTSSCFSPLLFLSCWISTTLHLLVFA
jgi:hypothetical protein